MQHRLFTLLIVALALVFVAFAEEQGVEKYGKEDMEVIHKLFENRDSIKRIITKLEQGVITETTSENPEVAELIKKHVKAMKERMESGNRIHQFDPAFVNIFDHADVINMELFPLKDGARVYEVSENECAAESIKEHAEVVSKFISVGMEEAHTKHPIPDICTQE